MDSGDPPVIPISATGTVAPNPTDVLVQVLQKLMDQNKPKDKLSDATPDQQAANQADASTKESGKKPVLPAGSSVKASENPSGSPSLPDIIDQLFGGKNSTESVKNPASGAQPAQQYTGGLTNLRNTLKGGGEDGKGNSKAGSVGAMLKFLQIGF